MDRERAKQEHTTMLPVLLGNSILVSLFFIFIFCGTGAGTQDPRVRARAWQAVSSVLAITF